MSYSRWGNAWAPGSWGDSWGGVTQETDALTSQSLTLTSEVDLASLGQRHALISQDLLSAAEVALASVSVIHVLDALGLTATSEVQTASLGQTYNLGARNVTSVTRITSGLLRQTQHLLSEDVEAASVIEQAQGGVIYLLEATELLSDSSIEGAVLSISGHALVALAVVSSAEVAQGTVAQVQGFKSYNVVATTTIRRPWAGHQPQPGQMLITDTAEQIGSFFPVTVDIDNQNVKEGIVGGVDFKRSHHCSICGNLYKESDIRWFRGKAFGVPCEDYKDIATLVRRRDESSRLAAIGRRE